MGLYILAVAVIAAFFALGFSTSRKYELQLAVTAVRPGQDIGEFYRPQHRRLAGPQLLLLLVGSSRCAWSGSPELPAAIEALKMQLAEYADREGVAFRAIGVSVDWELQAGLQHLTTFGAFDEISVGNNWENTILLSYAWERGYHASTPSVLVIQQHMVTDADSAGPGLRRVARDRVEVILHRSGTEEIKRLAALGPERFLTGALVTSTIQTEVGGEL